MYQKLSEEEMLQYVTDHWNSIPIKRREKIKDKALRSQYNTVCHYVEREALKRNLKVESDGDTLFIRKFRKLLEEKRPTKEELEKVVGMCKEWCDEDAKREKELARVNREIARLEKLKESLELPSLSNQ